MVNRNNQPENAAMDSQQPSLIKLYLPSAPDSWRRQSSLPCAPTDAPTARYHSNAGSSLPVVDRNTQLENATMDAEQPPLVKSHLPSAQFAAPSIQSPACTHHTYALGKDALPARVVQRRA